MPSALALLQERLDRHFSALREQRAKTLADQPTFGIGTRSDRPEILVELLEQIASYSKQAQIRAGSFPPNGTRELSAWAIW